MATTDLQPLPGRWQAAWRWGMLLLTLVALAALAWKCFDDPATHFLTPGPGVWITYPLPPRLDSYIIFKLTGRFRRAFVLPAAPGAGMITWRCFTNGELRVNGTVVPLPDGAFENWKRTLRTDVTSYLHPGTNEIEVEVVNHLGPPALCLRFEAGTFSLISDTTWNVSLSGSDWRPAQEAASTPEPGPGNQLHSIETVGQSLRHRWPWLCLFMGMGAVAVAVIRESMRRQISPARFLAGIIWAAWVLLLLHNFASMPLIAGFDSPDHLAYVRFVRDYGILPSAWEGAEMYQAPLYYVLSAVLLGAGHCHALEPAGMLLLRLLGLVIAAANLALVYAGLKLLFPGDWKNPLAGFALAAFLPAQLYLSHYTTNENLAAMFITASVYAAFRIIYGGKPLWRWRLALGISLGLALLSKSSAVLVIPVIFSVLSIKLLAGRERGVKTWLGVIVAPLIIALAMSGWHYAKLWSQYGNPLVLGGWDARVSTPWWQYKGVQTFGYFCVFGRVFSHPFFSGMQSFWDGFYSTLWGDGLLAGSNNFWMRPPWNYDFMAAGYLLAIGPGILVTIGLILALRTAFRQATLSWVMLILLGWLMALALVAMCLKVPHYAQAKAFFALPALLLFCALGALGWEWLAARSRAIASVIGVIAMAWLMNIYATYWIHPHSAQTEMSAAMSILGYTKQNAADAFAIVLKDYPNNSDAAVWLAMLEAKTNAAIAVQRLETTLRRDPNNDRVEVELARDFALSHQLDQAVLHARHAVELGPENEDACNTLCGLALQDKKYSAALAAGRQALGLNPANQDTHYNVGLALMNLRRFAEAAGHFEAIIDTQPAAAQSQFALGYCQLQLPGRQEDGIAHLEEAVRLDPTNQGWQAALQKFRGQHQQKFLR